MPGRDLAIGVLLDSKLHWRAIRLQLPRIRDHDGIGTGVRPAAPSPSDRRTNARAFIARLTVLAVGPSPPSIRRLVDAKL